MGEGRGRGDACRAEGLSRAGLQGVRWEMEGFGCEGRETSTDGDRCWQEDR